MGFVFSGARLDGSRLGVVPASVDYTEARKLS